MDQSLVFPIRQTTGDAERALVRRATDGDPEAFAELYERYVERIFRYIYHKVGSRTDAEDLTAQVFMKAWEAVGRYEWTGRPFGAWLYRMAHNAVVDHYRRQRETVPLDDVVDGAEPSDYVAQLTLQQLTVEALQHALAHLTDDQQEVIILRFLEAYSVGEVACLMKRRPGAVRALQHRALTQLCRILRPDPELATI
jgi:RNA polymerase sigma factor (sigma-70 family)